MIAEGTRLPAVGSAHNDYSQVARGDLGEIEKRGLRPFAPDLNQLE
jgi:hypothetical protein